MVLTCRPTLRSSSSLWFYSSRTVWRWSTPGFRSCASGGTVSSWRQRAGTTGCGYLGGRSCDHWRCFSTTLTWCKAWPSLTTRTPDKDCWLPDPRTSGSACGLYTTRELTLAEPLSSGRIYELWDQCFLYSHLHRCRCDETGVSGQQQLSNSPELWFEIWAHGLCIMFSYISVLILRSCGAF